MANTIKLKRGSGSDPGGSDLVAGEVALRTDNGKLFTKKDDGSVVSIGSGIDNVVEDTSPQLGGDLQSNGNDIKFADGDKAIFGTDNDLQLYHSAGESFVVSGNTVLNLRGLTTENAVRIHPDGAVELYHDNILRLATYNEGIQVLGTEGGNAAVFFKADEGDDNNDQYRLLAGDGSAFYLQNYASGGWETNILAIGNGAVELYHDNTKKIETTSTGIHVVGNVECDSITALSTGNAHIVLDSGTGSASGNQLSFIDFKLDGTLKANIAVNEAVSGTPLEINSAGTGATKLYNAASEKLSTTSAGIDVTGTVTCDGGTFDGGITFKGATADAFWDKTNNRFFHNDNVFSYWGTGGDFNIRHDGNHTVMHNITGNLYILGSDNTNSIIVNASTVDIEHPIDNDLLFQNSTFAGEVAGKIQQSNNTMHIQNGTNGTAIRHSDGQNHWYFSHNGVFYPDANAPNKYIGWSGGRIGGLFTTHFDMNASGDAIANIIGGGQNAGIEIGSAANSLIDLRGPSSNDFTFRLTASSGFASLQTAGATTLHTYTNNALRMQVTGNGAIVLGNQSAGSDQEGLLTFRGFCSRGGSSGSNGGNVHNFQWTGSALNAWVDVTNMGEIRNSQSDYRIKKDIQTQTALGIDRVKQLRCVTYTPADYVGQGGTTWSVASDNVKEGFIAHEVAAVIPSGVEGEKDDPLRIQQLNIDAIVSVLTKALQESITKIETLETKVAALESS